MTEDATTVEKIIDELVQADALTIEAIQLYEDNTKLRGDRKSGSYWWLNDFCRACKRRDLGRVHHLSQAPPNDMLASLVAYWVKWKSNVWDGRWLLGSGAMSSPLCHMGRHGFMLCRDCPMWKLGDGKWCGADDSPHKKTYNKKKASYMVKALWDAIKQVVDGKQ